MKLHKSMNDRIISGVCGGIAESLKINSFIVRAVFVIAAFATRSLVVWLYFAMGALMPYGHPDENSNGDIRKSSAGYRPEEPPFDISDAKDVDIDKK